MIKVFGGLVILLLVLVGLSTTSAHASDAVLIEFSSARCKFCTDMKPVISGLEKQGVAVRRVDVDRESEMAVRFEVRQLPTYVIVSGGKETTRLVGLQDADVMKTAIQNANRVQLTPTNAQANLDTSSAPQTRLSPVGYGGARVADRSEPMPSEELARAVARAEGATVRLRVFEEVGYGIGTGTVIDSHGDELLVLTCGHLFRDNKGQSKIEVDLFYAGEVHTIEGKVLDYDAKDRDIALVTVRTSLPITPVPVLASSSKPQNGASVFSFGCDRGANPSRRDTRITGIDLYNQHLNLSNIEIAGAPIDGRSGGGLFDGQGNLIGVCNAADYDDDIGIYAGPGEVYWQLSRVNMQGLFSASDSRIASNPVTPASQRSPPHVPLNSFDQDSEVIVIVRNRNRPQDQATVKVFDTPPAELMQLLQR
jgi:thiol-disulfide isomerase/thioredoxin